MAPDIESSFAFRLSLVCFTSSTIKAMRLNVFTAVSSSPIEMNAIDIIMTMMMIEMMKMMMMNKMIMMMMDMMMMMTNQF